MRWPLPPAADAEDARRWEIACRDALVERAQRGKSWPAPIIDEVQLEGEAPNTRLRVSARRRSKPDELRVFSFELWNGLYASQDGRDIPDQVALLAYTTVMESSV